MCKCKHPIVQLRYSVAFKENRAIPDPHYSFNAGDLDSLSRTQPRPHFLVVAGCAYCAAQGEQFSINIDSGELDIMAERARANFLHHAKNNSEMPEPDNKLPEFAKCPFCGSDQTAIIRESVGMGDHAGTIYFTSCASCGAMGPREDLDLKAFDLWNKRSV